MINKPKTEENNNIININDTEAKEQLSIISDEELIMYLNDFNGVFNIKIQPNMFAAWKPIIPDSIKNIFVISENISPTITILKKSNIILYIFEDRYEFNEFINNNEIINTFLHNIGDENRFNSFNLINNIINSEKLCIDQSTNKICGTYLIYLDLMYVIKCGVTTSDFYSLFTVISNYASANNISIASDRIKLISFLIKCKDDINEHYTFTRPHFSPEVFSREQPESINNRWIDNNGPTHREPERVVYQNPRSFINMHPQFNNQPNSNSNNQQVDLTNIVNAINNINSSLHNLHQQVNKLTSDTTILTSNQQIINRRIHDLENSKK
jgi:hypothetical protein